MGIGSTTDNQTILLAAAIAGIVVLPLVLWLLATIIGLVERVLGISSGIPGLVLVLAIPVALLLASVALDRTGQVLPGQVIDKRENVIVQSAGDWNDEVSVTFRYSVAGQALPPFSSTGAALVDAMARSSGQEMVGMRPSVSDFDRMYPGDSVDLRVLRVGTLLSLVRLASQSTSTLLPWSTLEPVLGVLALVFIAWRIRRTPLGYGPLAILALVGLFVPLADAYRTWQDRENMSQSTVNATATVGTVTRVTHVTFGRGSDTMSNIQVPQPYDIVQFEFVTADYRGPIVGVDAVDIDPNQPARFEQGATIPVSYAPGAARAARIPGQTRTHYLKTTLGFYLQYALFLLLGVAFVIVAWIVQGRKRRIVPQSPA